MPGLLPLFFVNFYPNSPVFLRKFASAAGKILRRFAIPRLSIKVLKMLKSAAFPTFGRNTALFSEHRPDGRALRWRAVPDLRSQSLLREALIKSGVWNASADFPPLAPKICKQNECQAVRRDLWGDSLSLPGREKPTSCAAPGAASRSNRARQCMLRAVADALRPRPARPSFG